MPYRRSAASAGASSPPYESRALIRTFAEPNGKLFLLYGSRSIFGLSLTMAAHAMTRGGSIAVVDGGNQFNVHLLAQFARRRRISPDEFLKKIFVSRGFTCYQMEQAVVNRLPEFLTEIESNTAMVFGLLETFYDEQVRDKEAAQIVRRVMTSLRRMQQEGMSILLVCRDRTVASAQRNQLLTIVKQGADRVFLLKETPDGGTALVMEQGEPYGTNRANLHQHHRPGSVELEQIPPRAPQRRPGTAR